MAEVTGDLGGQPIQLNNAATENTLKQLLAATLSMARATGKDAKAQAELEKELKRLAKEAKSASQVQEKLNKEKADELKNQKELAKAEEARLKRERDKEKADAKTKQAQENLKNAASNAADKIADVGKELVGLALGTSKLIGVLGGMEDSISKANQALGSIPLLGGFISGMLGPAADAAEKVYGQFSKLSQVGATFGGNMNSMIAAASGAGLTMEQFNGIVSRNAQGLALFAGTSEAGAKRMADIGKALKNSELNSQLLRMGFTTEEINNGMAAYIGTMSRTGALQGMSTQQIAAASGKYLKELDGLAKLTGQSREEKQKEMDELARDAQLNAAISHLSREEQEEARKLIASYPKQHQAAIKDMIATGNISSDAAIKFNAMMPQASAKFMQMGRTLDAGGKITKESFAATYDAYIDEAKVAKDRNRQLVKFNRDYDNEFQGIVEASSRQKGALNKAAGEQSTAASNIGSAAEQLGKFKTDVAKTSNEFTTSLMNAFVGSGGLEALKKALGALSSFAMNYVVPAMKFLFESISTVVDFLSGPITGKITGFILAFAPLVGAIGVAVIAIKGLMAAAAVVGTTLTGAVAGIAGTLGAVLAPILLPVAGVAAAIGALYLVLKAFNMDFTQLWHLVKDNVIDAFQSVTDFLQDIFVPAFDIMADLVNDIVMPAFQAVGDFLHNVFMTTLDAVSTGARAVGSFLSDKLSPIFEFFGDKVSKVSNFFKDLTGQIAQFVRGFDSLGSVTSYLGFMFKEFGLFIRTMALGLRDKLSWLPGITAPSMEEKETLEKDKQALQDEKKEAEAEREKVAQRRSAEADAKQAERDKERQARDAREAAERKKRDEDYIKNKGKKEEQAAKDKANAEVAAATAAAEAKAGLNYNDPTALLKGFKEQQTGGGATAAGTPAAAGGGTAAGATAPGKPINQDTQKNLELVKAALQKQGMTDPKYIAATLGNVMKETGGKSIEENLNYGRTSNDRIRSIFGSRAAGKTDAELDQIKKDPKQMGEMMYGSGTKLGQQMGNTEPGDGWKYRGRGFIQLTGKSNYAAASKAIYGDNRLVDNPDLVNDPAVAAEVSAWYMKKGQAGMAKQLGINTSNMTQDQANLLATSQIAGKAVKPGQGYLGGEVLNKVTAYSAQVAGIAGAPATATGTPAPVAQTPAAAAGTPVAGGAPAAGRPTAGTPAGTPAGVPTAVATISMAGADLQNLLVSGIQPTTAAFQELVSKGIKPLSGMLVSKTSTVSPSGNVAVEAATAKEKAAQEAEAKAKAEKEKQKTDTPKQFAPTQDTPESLLAELNTKMDTLIKISAMTADLNDKQLSVQRSSGNNLYA